MKIDWRQVVVGSMMGVVLASCSQTQKQSISASASGTETTAKANDPDARSFAGMIVSLRPMTSTMVISKNEGKGRDAYPNFIYVKYDADTKFLMDDHPATLMDIEQYMNVKIDGRMHDGQLVAETANFSSVLPPNVKRPPAQAKE